MGNVILKTLDNFNPKENDILVYDSKTLCWKLTTKEVYLNEVYARIKEVNSRIDTQNETIASLKKDLAKVAKIVKGLIE